MKFDFPNLFIEINEEKIIFLVVKYNEDLLEFLQYKLLE